MARLISIPCIAAIVVVDRASEIEALQAHPGLARLFVRKGRLLNRGIVRMLERQFRRRGMVLPAFLPRQSDIRAKGQADLAQKLDGISEAKHFPAIPIAQMARFVATGSERRDAEAALAYVTAWPYMADGREPPRDDAYKPIGRHLLKLHRRIERARSMLSPFAFMLRLTGSDRRAREQIIGHVGGDLYGLHAIEVTLANGREILRTMRAIVEAAPAGKRPTARDLAWAAIRTAPARIVRQSGPECLTLPHVDGRLPPHTLVVMRMRGALAADTPSGYEFSAAHWSACPARRFVMALFAAVAAAALDQRLAEVGP